MTETEIQFLNLINAAVNNTGYIPENPDWKVLFRMAEQHKLLPIIFDYVSRISGDMDQSELFLNIRKRVIAQVVHQTSRSMEFDSIYKMLRADGLHPVIFKGRLCSVLYLKPELRISCDDDILIPESENRRVNQLLTSTGLVTDTPEDELDSKFEITYTKENTGLCIEVHQKLFDDGKLQHDRMSPLFDGVFENLSESEGLLAMPPHYSFLHLILHAYKHFVLNGIGLRQICDIGLWARKYYSEIDWELLKEQCESVHAATFAATLFSISNDYLGIEFEIPEIWLKHPPAEMLIHDSITGGVFGVSSYSRTHTATMTLNAVLSSRNGEKSSIFSSIFPNVEYMSHSYPYVKKMPILLPVAWIQRLAHYADEKNNSSNNSSVETIKMAKERIALMKEYDIIN